MKHKVNFHKFITTTAITTPIFIKPDIFNGLTRRQKNQVLLNQKYNTIEFLRMTKLELVKSKVLNQTIHPSIDKWFSSKEKIDPLFGSISIREIQEMFDIINKYFPDCSYLEFCLHLQIIREIKTGLRYKDLS